MMAGDVSPVAMFFFKIPPNICLETKCEEKAWCRWVAAFSISAYGSSNARASHKPFNPLLGETFECIREDKGFRYVAEQVSPSSSQDLMIVTNCPR